MPDQLQFGDNEMLLALRKAWTSALHELELKVGVPSYNSWIKTINPERMNGRIVVLNVPSAFARTWLTNKFAGIIKSALVPQLGEDISIEFVVRPSDQKQDEPSDIEQLTKPTARPKRSAYNIEPLELNEDYVFDRFITGSNNRLAAAAACAVAEEPAQKYNPLFIYGSHGLGKTHLMHAIAHRLLLERPNIRIGYITGEKFTQQFVQSLRDRTTDAFVHRMSIIEVWLVDDIQFIAGKDKTNEEFFHIFNELMMHRRQVVLCSDRPPKQLPALDGRLRSRFEAGLIVDIAPPDYETRVAILANLCQQKAYQVPKEILYQVANAIESNIRTLEGVMVSVMARAQLLGHTITSELVDSVLTEYYIDLAPEARRDEKILKAVCEQCGIEREKLMSVQRDKNSIQARYIAYYLLQELAQMSLSQIGKMFGKDHSTVMNGLKRLHLQLSTDQQLAALIARLRKQIS